MRHTVYIFIILVFYSCNVKSSINDLSDCELISLFVNQLDILDEPWKHDIAYPCEQLHIGKTGN